MFPLVFLILIAAYSPMQQSGAPAQAPSIEGESHSGYQIGIDDVLDISVFDHPDLSAGGVRVDGNGSISLPLIGTVKAAGLEQVALERRIEAALDKDYLNNPHVTVSVKEFSSQMVTVVGDVGRAGLIPLRHPETLLDLLASVGGITNKDSQVIQVTRRNEAAKANAGKSSDSSDLEVISIDTDQLINKGHAELNISIYAGDMVNVLPPPLPSSVFVLGDVQKPGPVPISSGKGLTIRQAIVLGGGLAKTAKEKECTIVRTPPEGPPQQISINLKNLMKADFDDIPLMANDVVFVPSGASNGALKMIAQYSLPAIVSALVYILITKH